MPIFDYQCTNCKKRFNLLIGVVAVPQEEICPACGGANINRLISRFTRLRSEDAIIDDLSDPSKTGDLEDPKQLQNWMKHIGREMGEDLGDEFDEILESDEAISDYAL